MTQEAVLAERAAIDAEVEGKTIVDYLDRNAQRHGAQPALHYKDGDWKSLSWGQYRQAVHEAAAGFQDLGVGDGEFVAIMAGNRPEHVIADYAAIHSGATAVTIYSTLTAPQIQYIADNCKATVAVLEDLEFMKRWEEIRSELPNLRYVVLMSGAENYDTADWVLSWDELLIRGKKRLADDPDAVNRTAGAITPETLATLIYTSGTTGTPKGVMISHRNVVWTAECLRRAANIDIGPRMVSYLPLAHIAERLATHYLATYMAGQVWFCPNLAGVLEYILEARPTLFVGVPRVYEKFHSRLTARFGETHGVKKTLLDRALSANRKRVACRAGRNIGADAGRCARLHRPVQGPRAAGAGSSRYRDHRRRTDQSGPDPVLSDARASRCSSCTGCRRPPARQRPTFPEPSGSARWGKPCPASRWSSERTTSC